MSKILRRAFCWGVLGGVLGTGYLQATSRIEYTISLKGRAENRLHVRMRLRDVADEPLRVALPVWNNTYQIRDFARFIDQIEAVTPEGIPLEFHRSAKSSWQLIPQGNREIEIRYTIRASLPGSFSAEVTAEHAFLHAALICLFLPEHRRVPHVVRFEDYPPAWKVATGLELSEGGYRADDYDHLIDSPFELGTFELRAFQRDKVEYQVVVHGRRESFALDDLVAMLERIVDYQVRLMGSVPLRRYVFLYHVNERGSGGMEHRNSTAIGLRRARVAQDIGSAADVSAHEFFHLWNVKRIRPAEFEEMNWLQETPTRALWLSEGGTSYYSLLTRIRAGFIDESQFYVNLSREIRNLQNRPARLEQSAEQSSWETWFDRYPEYRRPESSISYYNKGLLICFLLDLEIRQRTGNRRSFDDVMRLMNVWFGERGVGFLPGDIRRVVESVAQSSFEDFFKRFVSGVEELPYQRILAMAGLELNRESRTELDPGFSLTRNFDDDPVVTAVNPGSPAATAGLLVNDRLLRLNGRSVGREDPLNGVTAGRPLDLTVQRRGQELELRFSPQIRSDEAFQIRVSRDSTPLQQQIRESLLARIMQEIRIRVDWGPEKMP